MKESTQIQNARRGFTLIELLVVIAIIAILAAILFPVFAQAKIAAKTSSTASSLRQIGLASTMYTNDYDQGIILTQQGDLDQTNLWAVTLNSYIKSRDIYSDPSRKTMSGADSVPVVTGLKLPWYQVVNMSINNEGYSGSVTTLNGACGGRFLGYNYGRSLAAMNEPERRIAFAPTMWPGTNVGWTFLNQINKGLFAPSSWTSAVPSRRALNFADIVHDTSAIYSGQSVPVVHADGSVGRLKASDFLSKAQVPTVAGWCDWQNNGAARTWGPYWNGS